MSKTVESVLKLKELYFDKLVFARKGPQNDNSIEYSFSVQIGSDKEEEFYKTILSLSAVKKEEFEIEICLQGVFSFSCEDKSISEDLKKTLIQKNTVAIMMPYIRSQLTILTSQPGVEPVVMQPFNINAMLDDVH